MLIKDYYTIKGTSHTEDSFTFHIHLNSECHVYQGHFPNSPVSPGVCNIQMIKECAENIIGRQLQMTNLQLCRLTTLVTPQTHPELDINIQLEEKDGVYKLRANLTDVKDICMELKAELITES